MLRRPMDFGGWYKKTFHELTGHGLWLRGDELNRLPFGAFDDCEMRALFVRLSTYFDTGYSFTHQILYQIAAKLPGVYADLGFLPPVKDAAIFARDGVPWLLGTQSKRDSSDFDLIGFSNSIVQEIINIPSFLRHSSVPLRKSDRLARSDVPLVVMGGANALYSSALWVPEPPIDGVFVGESDEGIRRILLCARDGKRNGASKRDILSEMEKIDGFFQPENPRSTKKFFIPKLQESEALEEAPVYYLADQLGSSHLQISEGCPCFCSFCAESWDRKPYRERRAENLNIVAQKLKAGMGLDEIDIYSFNFNMHSDLYQVLWNLVPMFRRIGLKSQRFDLLAHDPQMIEFQHVLEKASITCGLEGISPRLRKYLHKNLETVQLHDSLTAIFKSKARELKVFLIATGLEESQDIVALEDLLGHMREIHTNTHAGTRIIFSMTPLVRFPWTPLEFEDGFPMAHYARILKQVEECVLNAGFQFRASADLPEYWVSQVLVRAADPRIYDALLSALERSAFVYYRSVSDEFQKSFESTLCAAGFDPQNLLKGHTLAESAEKPWAKIDTKVKREFLWAEVERARAYKEIDYCLGRNWVKAECFRCGGCPSKFHIRDIVLARQVRPYSLDQFKARVKAARESRIPVHMLVNAGESARGVPRKMLAVALARAMMKVEPQLIAGYQGYSGSSLSSDDEPCWTRGLDALTLLWKRENLPLLEQCVAHPRFRTLVNAEMKSWGSLLGFAPSDWAPVGLQITSEVPFRGDEYLKSKGVKFTLRKSESRITYEISKDSAKKALILDLSQRSSGSQFETTLKVGRKFDVTDFLQASYAGPSRQEWVRVSCVVISGTTDVLVARESANSLASAQLLAQ